MFSVEECRRRFQVALVLYDIQKRGKLPAALYVAVNAIGDSDKPDTFFAKHNFCVLLLRIQIPVFNQSCR